ncbi:hypothetical protein [Bacillus cereus]|uniref:hypothetical protein n=1 Tax=Bacillus cereus TaxID=1396 RepID=UPI0024BC9E8D|nr:hypothetical protein [Bacillus cereus]
MPKRRLTANAVGLFILAVLLCRKIILKWLYKEGMEAEKSETCTEMNKLKIHQHCYHADFQQSLDVQGSNNER